ncbi:hypothetical protein B0H34DRAFT_48390 [Crassisporium funariophilum]|nr:hypothetical protein B0H34DRAFT_48390 [Crassisporium funariophilum]
MAVKDLVQLYESSSPTDTLTSTASPDHSTQARRIQPANTSSQVQRDLSAVLPPPRPARFIQRVEGRVGASPLALQGTSQTHTPPDVFSTKSLTNTLHHDRPSALLADSAQDSQSSLVTSRSSGFKASRFTRSQPSQTLVMDDDDLSEHELLVKHSYPPSSAWTSSTLNNAHASSSGLGSLHSFHKPIPAQVVFSRTASPLSLPKLDEYLASFPARAFGDEDCKTSQGMFPPMDQLAKTGLSLDDLETNSKVAPAWRNRKSILGATMNVLLGLMGSSALASFYSLQGLINTVQIFALILSTIVPLSGKNLENDWRTLFLGTIPNILALNFASILAQSLVILVIFMTIAAFLLYYFYRWTINCDRYNSIEGLQQTESKGKQWGLLVVTFLLTIIYLPLSTMSVHVLVWSEELWAIPNPYTNSTVSPPTVAPLGPPDEFRDPLDFCWTTTMKRNEVNFAPVVIILSSLVFVFLTVWYPLALHRVIRRSVPKVDKYTELGRPRSHVDMDGEYHRLLARDRNPFAFLYNGFRLGWGTYMSTYLYAKLSTLVIVSVIDPNNCFFRSLSRSAIPVVRQILLLLATLGFFIAQCVFAPFLDPVNNASEWTSRLNYVTTATTALAITLNIPGKDIIDTYVLYSIYIVTYGLSFYFSLINFGWMQRVVKRWTRRIDFSIDIFSPRLDISPSSIHTKRRIWQESVSALLLTDSECHIPALQTMTFAQARDSEFPPYLLDFAGTPGERHAENLKILREVGSIAYNRAVAFVTGPDFAWYQHLEDEIQENFIGPDSYWKRPGDGSTPNCTSYFGNAWWIPFPPTLVIRYDDGPHAVLTDASDLEAYIEQNSSRDIQRRRHVRMSLRSLEGQIVTWPYEDVQDVGSRSVWCCGRGRYNAVTSKHYQRAVLRIKRRGHLVWQGLHLGSGFNVELKYTKRVKISGDIIGLNEDFDLTPSLARFLELNKHLIDQGLYEIEGKISSYRRYHRKECRRKTRVLTYRFLAFVYDQPRDPDGLAQSSIEFERDRRVRQLMMSSEPVFKLAYKRLDTVSVSEAATWWYIFWDDLWRRNHDTISGLELYASDFNPHYATSIAYTPLPRAALESFLIQRGLLHSKPRWNDFFHAGFLNKVYLRLNDAVFRDSRRAIMLHLGNDRRELDMEDIDILTQGQPSTLGTGGGTDHDDSWIRARPTYRWEGLLNDPPRRGGHEGRRKWFRKLGAWFGITPLWRSGSSSNGISLDVRLDNGRYVLLDDSSSVGGASSQRQ